MDQTPKEFNKNVDTSISVPTKATLVRNKTKVNQSDLLSHMTKSILCTVPNMTLTL